MNQDELLRRHLKKILNWQDAHVNFDRAVEGIPQEARGVRPEGFPYSLWEVLEHIRICQFDILDFCRNAEYKERAMEEYWPNSKTPSKEEWEKSIADFHKDRTDLIALIENSSADLFAKIPHGDGQTYLREILLVADHNAYHVADLVAIRRTLGIWK
jgi:DinB family protein